MTVAIRAGTQLSCSPSNQIKTKQVSAGSNCGAGRVCRAPVVRPHNFQQSPASNHSSSHFHIKCGAHTRNSSQSNKLLCTSPQHYMWWVTFRCHCKMQNPTFPTHISVMGIAINCMFTGVQNLRAWDGVQESAGQSTKCIEVFIQANVCKFMYECLQMQLKNSCF